MILHLFINNLTTMVGKKPDSLTLGSISCTITMPTRTED